MPAPHCRPVCCTFVVVFSGVCSANAPLPQTPLVLVISDGVPSCFLFQPPPTQEFFGANLSTYPQARTRLGPIKCSCKSPCGCGSCSGDTFYQPGSAKLPPSSCSGDPSCVLGRPLKVALSYTCVIPQHCDHMVSVMSNNVFKEHNCL